MKLRRIAFLSAVVTVMAAVTGSLADDLVILHTNDTHSNIDPDASGKGGILQRKAIIDSVRKAEKNVVLVDAGDMVQGSLYFKYFGGDVEYPLMNMMGYDVRILGNHEFDNGLRQLAKHYKDVEGARLSVNYDFEDTPLKGYFRPYLIKKTGGKKIGFIGLNINPESLIAKDNYTGLKYKDIIAEAKKTASLLKRDKKCDLVVAVTHIGVDPKSKQPTDYDLARSSEDIDIIIGGHSHTLIEPDNKGKYPSIVKNAVGRPVLIAQAGKYGRQIGYIRIDLDDLKSGNAQDFDYKLIDVTDRFPASQLDKKMVDFIAPYKHVVDSVNSRIIAKSLFSLKSDDRNGGYANFTGDFALWYGQLKLDSLRSGNNTGYDKVDIGFMNVGGIRQDMPAGNVTKGEIMSTFPFANRMVLLQIEGKDLIEVMRVSAMKGGEAVSGNVRVVVAPDKSLRRVVIDGKEIQPDKTYLVSTIDYIAAGNDNLTGFAAGKVIWKDSEEMLMPMLRYIKGFTSLGLPIAPDMGGRFIDEVIIQ